MKNISFYFFTLSDWHTAHWDGRTASGEKASSGMYFCRLQAGNYTKTIKMMLLP
jgi:hypothetical protein